MRPPGAGNGNALREDDYRMMLDQQKARMTAEKYYLKGGANPKDDNRMTQKVAAKPSSSRKNVILLENSRAEAVFPRIF